MTEETPFEINGIEVTTSTNRTGRMATLLWGNPGCGKTTLAATAPGKKLWLNYDADGTSEIASWPDIYVLDMVKQPDNSVTKFSTTTTPFVRGIEKAITEHDIDTIVVDSVTSFGTKALRHGVIDASTSIEEPGFKGYGRKSTWTKQMIETLLSISAKHNTHIIFICHEDKPNTDKDGNVLFITLMLGSSLSTDVPINISEVWWVQDTGKERRIAIRPCRARRPMKTKIFQTGGDYEFPWKFNPETREGLTLEEIFLKWKSNGYKKLPLPGTKEYATISITE